ncbi:MULTISPECIES: hypothetical protein [unclassified Sphingobacterium]|uniref:hypothetical protein n=1 Tax=unclassified Sphingobacterium TaxID=2609468 RepID=UPI0025CDBA16|nr:MULTISPECIES: hypothetical protein [unclassified Sphingobacterium]
MTKEKQSISANEDEISLYTYTGEAIWKIQVVEQALSFWITLKLNPNANIAQADIFLKELQSFTLGKAIKTAKQNRLFNKSLQAIMNPFLIERNWLIHKSLSEIQQELDYYNKRKEIINDLCKRIKSISDTALIIQREIEYDMIRFCESQNRDISKIREIIKLQESGKRIYKY